jgi:hypothetical protein
MILALEILLTVGGLWMLCTGRTWGKNSFSHWQLRLLGGLMMTLLPVALVAVLVFSIIYAATHPGLSEAEFAAKTKWPLVGIEGGTVLVYAVVAGVWESRLRSRERAADMQPLAAGEYPVGPFS